ncbi:AbrB/MazE/SpoVT family DNA-binding domain-containing protein [Paenibacillus larvae]|uniref:AbrB/MazE/SpoVT family DNA-binding domain-containing protein n=1 Tax=Paenibacillus larvae TaxID=1464 RepID=UPI002283134E|nr:AbrB/MazE/SpoVT family DNA-binding domain-containing protein [Paenibacillus larvae]MCY9500064.1 AbrB/MazE/SpoVT family DNA-binding domain-containing protein [Paenibacillus larvae]
MGETGIVWHIDSLGRFVIPKEIRNALNIRAGEFLKIVVDQDKIVLSKYKVGCELCGSVEDVISMSSGKLICRDCLK